METIIEKLESLAQDIKWDIKQDWNENKLEDTLDLSKLEIAISILKQIKPSNNQIKY